MITYIIAFATLVLLFLLFKNRNTIRIIYIKKLTLPAVSILFILCLILFSNTAVKAASKGIYLWFNIVFPSLFPFFVCSEILNKSGFVKAIGILLEPIMRPLFNVPGCGSFAFAMGITSGYPVGAKITTSMREENLISKTEAERLLAFTNNSGPLFVIGAVGVGMFKSAVVGYFLLACHILACITIGFIFGQFSKRKTKRTHSKESSLLRRFVFELGNINTDNLGGLFGDAIKNSISLLLAIGGFIIFFSVIINLMLETGFINFLAQIIGLLLTPMGLDHNTISAIISGFIEITTGTNMVSNTPGITLIQQLTAASAIIGWAGMSVHTQVMSITNGTGISIKPYLVGKFLQGVFSSIYAYTALKWMNSLFIRLDSDSVSAFKPTQTVDLSWIGYFMDSIKYSILTCILLMLLAVFSLFLSGYLLKGLKR